MKLYRGQFDCAGDAVPFRGIGLGNFDGIHAGHAELIRLLTSKCAEKKLPAMVYTFENHPNNVIFKEKHTPLIMTEERKIKILEEMGVDELFLEHFDEAYAHTEPERFVKEILVDRLHAKLVVVGYDYTYGDHGRGTPEALSAYGEKYGFEVFVVPRVQSFLPDSDGPVTVSSTLLRGLIRDGKMQDFKALTGRYYTIPGCVVRGRNVGASVLGFPTANILPRQGFAIPNFGVYATNTKVDGKFYQSITNIGNNPTFRDITAVTIETYLIGFKGELYGHDIEVEFIGKMREQIMFASPDALSRQLQNDADERKNMDEGIRKIYHKDGLEIYHVPADKFKTSVVKIVLCDNLRKERAYKNALIPMILNAASVNYPSFKLISERLQELYGASLSVGSSSLGEIQYAEFLLEYTDARYIHDDPNLENNAIAFLFELLTAPVTEDYNGKPGFLKSAFERERTNRNEQIASLINDKHVYAQRRCEEVMCAGEPYSVYHLGAAKDGESLTPAELYEYYRTYFLDQTVIKIFYCGAEFPAELTELAVKNFGGRQRIKLDGGYLEKRDIPPTEMKYVEERMDVTQAKLFLGYRTNMNPASPNYYLMVLCNIILGQGTQSKLFTSVREQNSLAYYAASYMNKLKGVMFTFCAIDPQKEDQALQLMIEQTEAMREGNITQKEFESAVKMLSNDLLSYGDSQNQLLNYYFGQTFMSTILTPQEYIGHLAHATREDVIQACSGLTLDTIYFLTGKGDHHEGV